MILHKAMGPWIVTLKSAVVFFFYSGLSIYLTWIRIRNANRIVIELTPWMLDIYSLPYPMEKKIDKFSMGAQE